MKKIHYRLIEPVDAGKLSQYYLSNHDHFKAWSPLHPYDHHSVSSWGKRLPQQLQHQAAEQSFTFVAINTKTNAIIAHCALSQIFYGPFHACYMGYAIDQYFEGNGIMPAFCQHVIDYAFKELKLNRIMANYMPHNNRSARLLKKLGFVWEGRASRYLKINGKWEDHMLTSLTNPRST